MYMTIEEIDKKYDGEWVYIINLKEGKNYSVLGGEVVAHNEDRDKVLKEMLKYPDGGIYVKYAGKAPVAVSVFL